MGNWIDREPENLQRTEIGTIKFAYVDEQLDNLKIRVKDKVEKKAAEGVTPVMYKRMERLGKDILLAQNG